MIEMDEGCSEICIKIHEYGGQYDNFDDSVIAKADMLAFKLRKRLDRVINALKDIGCVVRMVRVEPRLEFDTASWGATGWARLYIADRKLNQEEFDQLFKNLDGLGVMPDGNRSSVSMSKM